jgi:hypothetical protein
MWLNYFENDRHFRYHKILKRSWVQTKWRAGEIPAGSLLLGLTWGLRNSLSVGLLFRAQKNLEIYYKKKILKRNPACLLFRFPA